MSKLIKFETEDCTYCKMVQNVLDANEVSVDKINPFDNPEMAAEFDIGSVPVTILLDDNDNEIQRSIGFKTNELEELINKLGE